MISPFPDFYIVGAPKCGTTSLAAMLSNTPGAFIPTVKEPHYFGSDIPGGHFEYYRDRSAYLSLYKGHKEAGLICGDASVWYYRSDKAPDEIFESNKNAKIIVMVRKAPELIESLYFHKLYGGDERREDIGDAVFSRAPNKGSPKWTAWGLEYLEAPRWSKWIPKWKRVFGDNFRIYTLNEFSDDPMSVYLDVCAFLGLKAEPSSLVYSHKNKNKKNRSLSLQRMTNIFPLKLKIIILKIFGGNVEPVRKLFASIFFKKKKILGLTLEQKKYIESVFSDDEEYLKREFGLTWTSRK